MSKRRKSKPKTSCSSLIVAAVVIVLASFGLSQIKTSPAASPPTQVIISTQQPALINITIHPTQTIESARHFVSLTITSTIRPTQTLKPTALPVKIIHPTYTPKPRPTAVPVSSSGGSTCVDGTHSNSTGKGTCSHHGGVAH